MDWCHSVAMPTTAAEDGGEQHTNNEGDAKNDQQDIHFFHIALVECLVSGF